MGPRCLSSEDCMRSFDQINADRERLRARRSQISQDLDLANAMPDQDAGTRERVDNLSRGLDRIDAEIETLDGEWSDAMRDYAQAYPDRLISGDGGAPHPLDKYNN